MKARTLTTLAILALPIGLAAQTPQPAPPSKPTQPPAPTTPATQPPATRKPAQATRGPIEVRVTSRSGEPVAGVAVTLEGNLARSGETDQDGVVLLRSVPAGQYRLRFAKTGWMALEREFTVRQSGTTKVEVALSEAETPPPAPAPPPVAAPPPPPAASAGNVEPRTVVIPDFIDQNYVGRAQRKDSVLGCTDSMKATLLQLREPLAEHTHANGDEVLYIVAGEATHKVAGRETKLDAGTYSLVPRGVPHSITRRGSNPIVLLSIETGQPCANGVTAR
jgi:mannose-6-phosphate isomerase-like protein (cupin superfamily)